MRSHIDFIKFWGGFFLDLKAFKSNNIFLLKNLVIKTKFSSNSNDLIGVPEVFFKPQYSYYSKFNISGTYNIFSNYKFFIRFSEILFIFSIKADSSKIFTNRNFSATSFSELDFFYVNSNIFLHNCLFKINFYITTKSSLKNQQVFNNLLALRGLAPVCQRSFLPKLNLFFSKSNLNKKAKKKKHKRNRIILKDKIRLEAYRKKRGFNDEPFLDIKIPTVRRIYRYNFDQDKQVKKIRDILAEISRILNNKSSTAYPYRVAIVNILLIKVNKLLPEALFIKKEPINVSKILNPDRLKKALALIYPAPKPSRTKIKSIRCRWKKK